MPCETRYSRISKLLLFRHGGLLGLHVGKDGHLRQACVGGPRSSRRRRNAPTPAGPWLAHLLGVPGHQRDVLEEVEAMPSRPTAVFSDRPVALPCSQVR